MALAPAIIALGLFLVAMLAHDEYVRWADLSAASGALAVAGALALLWLLVGAINWQIKEAGRAQSR